MLLPAQWTTARLFTAEGPLTAKVSTAAPKLPPTARPHAPLSAELKALAAQLEAEHPGDRAFAAGLAAALTRTERMKDENRPAALQRFAGDYVASKLGLTEKSHATLGNALGKHPGIRKALIELLEQFPRNPAFVKGLRAELRHVFPELAGRHGRPSDAERLSLLNGYANAFALTADAMAPKVYAQFQELAAQHPHDEDYLRGLRELVRAFPHRKSLSGSMTADDALSALRRYDASFTQAQALQHTVVSHGVDRKVADPAPAAGEKPYSNNAYAQLTKAFSKDALAFFDLYGTMQDVARGQPMPADLGARIDAAVGELNRLVAPDGKRVSPDVLNDARRGGEELKGLLAKMAPDAAARSPQLLDRFRVKYQSLMLGLARDKGVELTQISREQGTWGDFRVMTERQSRFAALAAQDPQLAGIIEQKKLTYRQIDEAIQREVVKDGRVPRDVELMGRIVTLGASADDPRDVLVYDFDGKKRTIDEFKEHRLRFIDSMKRLAKEPDETEVPLSTLRSVSPAQLEALEGPTESVALTDDKAKTSGLTCIYDTRWDGEQRVVVSGRFKGVYLDDLINANGRLIEGTAFTYDNRTGATHGVPVKTNLKDREPYVTLVQVKERGVLKDKLFVRLPGMQGEWTEVRRRLRALTEGRGAVPTIQYQQGSKNTAFYFDAKDFAAVKDALSGMSLSGAALGHVKGYFDALTVADRAVNARNVENFSEKFLPGLKPDVKLLTPQKEAMAWLEANGNRGVVALDTGIGKTLLAISQMQKLLRDGYDGEGDSNGRFIYVCPKSLRGNVISEIHKFLEPDDAAKLIDRLDVVSYEDLARATKAGELDGRPFDPKKYVSAFFDETQEVNRDTGSQKSRAALGFDNPRKVCLTASPMEQNPMEAYVLNCIAANIDLRDPQQRKAHLTDMKRFKERYCETLGGRIVGVKKDPLVRQELATWVKQNVFFRDKREVPEFALPQLRRHSRPVVMSEEHEKLYEKHLTGFKSAMRALVSTFRDKGLLVDAVDDDGNPVKRMNPAARSAQLRAMSDTQVKARLKELRLLATAPALAIPDEVAKNAADPKNAKLISQYQALGTPVIDAAVDRFRARLRGSPQSRAAVFSENRKVVLASAEKLSLAVPGTVHAACLSDRIVLFKNGKQLDSYAGHSLPFVPREYRKDPSKRANGGENRVWRKNEWQQFAIRELLLNDRNVKSLSMLGQTYQQGFNLQPLDTVMHLDLVMNAQDVQQREARVWRQGNLSSDVDIDTFVPTFADPKSTLDLTVGQLDEAYVALYEEIFDQMIKESQQTELGKEWFGDIAHREASRLKVSADRLELFLSPYLSKVAKAA
ncbi:MAG: hypothetical protein IPJ65_39255 [Archangiaceae bacterium]|nr:hypothetical protein [Archangiaceae bacterium]